MRHLSSRPVTLLRDALRAVLPATLVGACTLLIGAASCSSSDSAAPGASAPATTTKVYRGVSVLPAGASVFEMRFQGAPSKSTATIDPTVAQHVSGTFHLPGGAAYTI